MATNVTTQPLTIEDRRNVAKTIFGGSLVETVAAGITIVLSLIALSGTAVGILFPVGVIAMAIAFLVEGGAISMRFSRLLAEACQRDVLKADFVGIGLTAEIVGGLSGLVLGILAITGMAPMILLPVSVIIYGVTLILSSGLVIRLNDLEFEGVTESARYRKIAHEMTTAAAAVEFLLGIGSLILGIVAITGIYSLTLSLVALLIIGISAFVTGAAISNGMAGIFRSRSV